MNDGIFFWAGLYNNARLSLRRTLVRHGFFRQQYYAG